jgi:hypothetical protein
MSRTLLVSALATLVLSAAVVPATASRRSDSDGNSKSSRKATALWPSERPYHVDMGPCTSRTPVLVRNRGAGPANIWVTNINCDPPGRARHWLW